MAKFRINPRSLEQAKANFQAATERKVKKIAAALGGWGLDVKEEIGKEIIANNAIDQGQMLASTTVSDVTRLGNKLKVSIFNNTDQSIIDEFGRQPGGRQPPMLPMIGWAVRHGMARTLAVNPNMSELSKELAASAAIMRNMGKGGGGTKTKKKPLDPVIRDLLTVRLLMRKIAERGIKARHSFSRAWDRKSRTFAQDIAGMVR